MAIKWLIANWVYIVGLGSLISLAITLIQFLAGVENLSQLRENLATKPLKWVLLLALLAALPFIGWWWGLPVFKLVTIKFKVYGIFLFLFALLAVLVLVVFGKWFYVGQYRYLFSVKEREYEGARWVWGFDKGKVVDLIGRCPSCGLDIEPKGIRLAMGNLITVLRCRGCNGENLHEAPYPPDEFLSHIKNLIKRDTRKGRK